MTEVGTFRPGFQGSETSGVEVVVYPQGNDVILGQRPDKISFEGRVERDRTSPVTAVSTQVTMGSPSHTWKVELKSPEYLDLPKLEDLIVDDDWIDIVFTRHARRFHVMRGLVDEIRRRTTVAQDGSLRRTYTLTGRSFGSIFERTPIWYNMFSQENAGGANTLKLFEARNIQQPVDETVKRILLGFLDDLGQYGRAVWRLPRAMPGGGGRFFARLNGGVAEFVSQYADDPGRIAINSSLMDPNGVGLWSVAQEWSDPMFVELFTDIWSGSQPGATRPPENEEELDLSSSVMAIVLRDRPFPTSERIGQTDGGLDSAWFNLPIYTVPRQAIVNDDVGRGGQERFNAFFLSPQITQEIGSARVELAAPLWDLDDMLIHGMRRLEVMSRYKAIQADLITMTEIQRARLAQWHALNPYFLNGTIQLAHGRPDIRIGGRLRIPGVNVAGDETYYLEQVSHDWSYEQGIRTSLGVSRGWVGDDKSLIDAIAKAQTLFKGATKAKPGDALNITTEELIQSRIRQSGLELWLEEEFR